MEKKEKLFGLKNIVLMALFAALTCVLAPLSVPIGPVPISLTNLVIYFSVFILGWQRATITYIVYLLLGMVGLPVFSNFEGGIGKLAGPTGGYLIGFILMAIICGLFNLIQSDKVWLKYVFSFLGMVMGTAVACAFGTAWFCFSTGTGLFAALLICVFPFIIGDLVKIVVALVAAPPIATQIKKLS